ncbi:hypothetical protein GCM10010218_01190 [Streptomyces mashuensis]|uniref:histidine kinase n=1 Tax=Streptomyces mashuensis TaxID=33904 RepID=A0A919ATE5_9ACTN|nr:hypothetical protein GCM10010218_01190 [Streptomyces mashuensis]
MSHHIPEVVIWCLVAALTAVAVLLARQRTITTGLRRRVTQLEDSVGARDEELGHLVAVRLPAVGDSVGQEVPLPGPLDDRLAGTEFTRHLQAVMDLFTQAVDKAQARADQSAKAALKASMRALQGLAHEQQMAISEMQERHDDPEVLRDLLEIDHTNSQFGRRAQAIAVLCGSWPGRQRVASPLMDVVRGATSRIRDYRRVQVHDHLDTADIAVISRAVEPVVLAVAELLDNAARHSQPNTSVEVSLQPVHNGACVVVDDAGVGMDAQEVQRAAAVLSGRRPVDVSRLGDPPQFGFPVIGVLAARYGFSVSVDTRSPYGGVRAVLFLPGALLTQLELDGPSTTPLTTRASDHTRATRPRPNGPSRRHARQSPHDHGLPTPPVTPETPLMRGVPYPETPAGGTYVAGATRGEGPAQPGRRRAPEPPFGGARTENPGTPGARFGRPAEETGTGMRGAPGAPGPYAPGADAAGTAVPGGARGAGTAPAGTAGPAGAYAPGAEVRDGAAGPASAAGAFASGAEAPEGAAGNRAPGGARGDGWAPEGWAADAAGAAASGGALGAEAGRHGRPAPDAADGTAVPGMARPYAPRVEAPADGHGASGSTAPHDPSPFGTSAGAGAAPGAPGAYPAEPHPPAPAPGGTGTAAGAPPAPPGAGGDAAPDVHGTTAGGLPKRRRRQPARGFGRPLAPPVETPPERTAEETARRMGAFARGTRAGRTDGRGERYHGDVPAEAAEDEGNPHA